MKIVVIGSNGMLARDLVALLKQTELTVSGFDLPELDITRPLDVISLYKDHRPDLVINCAAYTAVDRAEAEPDVAFAVNAQGAANLAVACKQSNTPLIHLSTDYVFDGEATYPYREDDPANPQSVYGRSKWEGEEAIRSLLNEHLIVRTSWLFGIHGQNFVKTILRLAREREELRVVADQHGCPTWTGHLSSALLEMAKQVLKNRNKIKWGTYHFCGRGRTTWHGFAEAIAAESSLKDTFKIKQILPISTAEYPTPAHRPAWSVLDCHEIEMAFGILQPSWRAGLHRVIQELFATGS